MNNQQRTKGQNPVLRLVNYLLPSHRGVSLIELTIAVAITSLFIVLSFNFLADKYAENALRNGRAELQLQAQLTLDLMNRDIKNAAAVDGQNRWADSNAPGSPANDFSWSSNSETLILAVPAQDVNDNILYEDANAYVSYKNDYIYFVSGGVLYKRILAATASGNEDDTTCPQASEACAQDIKLADNIESFAVTYFDANDDQVAAGSARSVKISLRTSRMIYGKTVSVDEDIRAVMRNE